MKTRNSEEKLTDRGIQDKVRRSEQFTKLKKELELAMHLSDLVIKREVLKNSKLELGVKGTPASRSLLRAKQPASLRSPTLRLGHSRGRLAAEVLGAEQEALRAGHRHHPQHRTERREGRTRPEPPQQRAAVPGSPGSGHGAAPEASEAEAGEPGGRADPGDLQPHRGPAGPEHRTPG